MKNFYVRHKQIIWIMLIIFAFRLAVYFLNSPYILYQNDTNTYSVFKATEKINNPPFRQNIFKGEINSLRTPLYPWFIKLVRFIFSSPSGYLPIVISQSIISLFAVFVLYKIIRKFTNNKKVLFWTTLAYGLQPTIFHWDKVIITESLSLSFSVFFAYCLIDYLENPKTRKALWLAIFSFLLVMLRPSFLSVFVIIGVFWILRFIINKKDRNQSILGFITSLLCTCLIFAYINANAIQNKTPSLTKASIANKIMNLVDADIWRNNNYADITKIIAESPYWDTSNPSGGKNYELFHNGIAWRPFEEKYNLTDEYINEYANDTIGKNKMTYIKQIGKNFINSAKPFVSTLIMTSSSDKFTGDIDIGYSAIYEGKEDVTSWNFNALTMLSLLLNGLSFFLYIYIFVFISFFINLWKWIKGRIDWIELGLCTLIISEILTVVIGCPTDFARLLQPIIPFVAILLFKQIAEGKWAFVKMKWVDRLFIKS